MRTWSTADYWRRSAGRIELGDQIHQKLVWERSMVVNCNMWSIGICRYSLHSIIWPCNKPCKQGNIGNKQVPWPISLIQNGILVPESLYKVGDSETEKLVERAADILMTDIFAKLTGNLQVHGVLQHWHWQWALTVQSCLLCFCSLTHTAFASNINMD